MEDSIRKRFYFKYKKAQRVIVIVTREQDLRIFGLDPRREFPGDVEVILQSELEADVDRVEAFAMSAMYAAGEFRRPE